MKISLLVVALCILVSAAQAQQIATTEDGKKVRLHSDGTWKYLEDAPPGGVTLTLDAGIVYKLGGSDPVARVTFALLDKFPTEELAKLPAHADAGYEYLYSCGKRPENARQLMARHTVYKLTTDFQGKAELSGIKPGQYVLIGGAETRGGCAMWTLTLDLTKSMSVTLDQNNAAYIK